MGRWGGRMFRAYRVVVALEMVRVALGMIRIMNKLFGVENESTRTLLFKDVVE